MKKVYIFAALLMALSRGAFAQQAAIPPDCQVRFSTEAAPYSSGFVTNYTNNSGPACVVWELRYAVAGTASALSIVVQLAPPSSGTPTAPGTFITYNGTAIQGNITNTNTSGASALLGDGVIAAPFVRVHLTSLTASAGTFVYGVLQGWNAGNAAAIVAGGGSGGTGCPNPCPVIQSNGALLNATVQGADANAGAASHNPFLTAWLNAGNLQESWVCPNQAAFNLSAGTDVLIVAGTMGAKTYVCHLDFSSDTSATFTVRQGTTVSTPCDTGTAAVTGAYPNVTQYAMDYQPTAALHTTTNANNLCLHASATVNAAGGTVFYGTF